VLDGASSRFDCSKCSPGEQRIRNCDGNGTPAKLPLNGQLYRRCPRAIYIESAQARALVELYFGCEKYNNLPSPGIYTQQTAYTVELFDYISGIINETKERLERERASKSNK
jgi:hypothetical protein